jgi:hypothetical protein
MVAYAYTITNIDTYGYHYNDCDNTADLCLPACLWKP